MIVSIITVCFNAQATIEKAIQSVLSQSYTNIEFIVIDGKSTDGTLPILHKYKDYIDHLSSEKDNGIYNAMNKGILAANGDIVFFLNTDDAFANDFVIEKVVEQFLQYPHIDLLYGDVLLLEKGSTECTILKKHLHVDKMYFLDNTICHQAIFSRMSIFEKYGFFDETFKLAGDYEWLLRVLVSQRIFSRYIDMPVAIYSMEGMSSQEKGLDNILSDERHRVQKNYFSKWEKILYQSRLYKNLSKNLLIKSILRNYLDWDLH